MIVNMISGPRNVSTAMMYSFAQHPLFEVVDEPFYSYYLKESGVDHPGREEVLVSLPTAVQDVVQQLKPKVKNHLFIKNMAHHLIMVKDRSFLKNMKHLFLIRHPAKLISSFAKVIEKPTLRDIGLKDEYVLFNEIAEYEQPVVIDSDDLLKDPGQVLKTAFDALGLPFDKKMLKWKAGPRKEDGVWAPYWYKNVHASTGFTPYQEKKVNLNGYLSELYKEALPYYKKLSKHAIKV